MEITNLLRDISLEYNQLTKTEKKIADYVLQYTDKVLFMSITDLADACRVADASVHRFCRTIGLKGYQEFKMRLTLSINADRMEKHEEEAKHVVQEPLEALIEKSLKIDMEVLQETTKILDMNEINRTITMMEEAKSIYFLGIGDSLLSAKEASHKFMRISNKIRSVDDAHMQAMSVSLASPEDLIVILSYSGASKDNIYIADIAKSVGAKIVVISRFTKSPLTPYADALLLCGADENPLDGGSFGAKLSQLFIIDILYKEYYRRNETASKSNKEKTVRAVVDKLM